MDVQVRSLFWVLGLFLENDNDPLGHIVEFHHISDAQL